MVIARWEQQHHSIYTIVIASSAKSTLTVGI